MNLTLPSFREREVFASGKPEALLAGRDSRAFVSRCCSVPALTFCRSYSIKEQTVGADGIVDQMPELGVVVTRGIALG